MTVQTLDELKAQLKADCPFWDDRQWEAFMAAPPEEQNALATALHLSGQGPGIDMLKTALTILQEAEPAFAMIPAAGPFISGGIQAFVAIMKLIDP
jgi:hypothetical protein